MDFTCAICFDDIFSTSYFDNHRLYITSCNHKYHYSCLYKWCYRKNICPICRTPNVINNKELFDEVTYLPLNVIDDPQIQTHINIFLDIIFLFTLITLLDNNTENIQDS